MVGHGVGHGLPYSLPVVNYFKTRLSIAVNLCKNNVLHQSVISTILFRPFGGVSLKFSKHARGRLKSGKPECRVNTTLG